MTKNVEPEPSQKRPNRGNLRALLSYLKKHRALVVWSIVLSVAGSALSLAQPLLVSAIVADLDKSVDITPTLGLLLTLVGAAAIVSGFQTYVLLVLGEGVVRSVRKSLIRKIFSLSFTDLRRFRRAELVSRATTDTAVLKTALTQSTTQLVGGTIMFVGAIIAMAFVSPSLLGITLSVVALAIGVLLGMSGRLRRSSVRAQESIGQVASSTDKYLRALKTIRSLNAQQHAVESIEQGVDSAWRSGLRFARISATITPLSGVALQVSLASVLGFGGYQVSTGAMTVAQLIAFIMYLFLLLSPIGQAIAAATSLAQALASMSRLQEVETLPDIEPLHSPPATSLFTTQPEAPSTSPGSLAVEFRGVTFQYSQPGNERDAIHGSANIALRDVSFAIPHGAKVGIVGPSGAGKSTLLALISRFYDPDDGEIKIYNMASRSTPREVLRTYIGLVEQDAPIIAGTLRDNLTLGTLGATTADCTEVLASVNLTNLLSRGNGLDLNLADEGSDLSGGERQRLAIARVLLADPPILLLDESTSQMDSDNESMLRAAISTAAKDRTLIVVAHRLSTIIDSDVIFVLRDGGVEDQGTHHQLLETNETYRTFARQQSLVPAN